MKENRATNNPGATYSISFEPLWRSLEERGVKRSELAARIGLSRVTIAKMSTLGKWINDCQIAQMESI